MLRGAKRRGNPFPARHRRADGTSGTPSPTERFAARRAGRGSEFHPARGIPKRKTTLWVVFLYFSRSAQQNRRGSNSLPGIPRMAEPFVGTLPLPLDLTRCAPVEAASSILPAAFQKETPSCRMVFLFGAGDEARTRYLDLGKVALYQMSYARKRKIDYTSHRSVCQPRFPNFRKNLMPALAGGHAGIYRMMISTTPGLSALG